MFKQTQITWWNEDFFLALFVVVVWISGCLMCFPLVLDGVWLFFLISCWLFLMVFDGDWLVFDGVWSRLMICWFVLDGFSMGFCHGFLMLRDGVRYPEGELFRWWFWVRVRGDSDGLPLEVIMDSPVLKHRGKVCLAQWRKTWKTMEGTFAKIFWGAKTWQINNSQVFLEFPNFKAHVVLVGSQMWRQSQVWSLMMFYPCSHLFTWFVDPQLMSCWVCFSWTPQFTGHIFGFLPMKYHIHSDFGVFGAAPRHRYFFSRQTATMLDADDEADGIFARWADFGDWQARDVAGLGLPYVGGTFLEEKYGKVLEVDIWILLHFEVKFEN